MHQQRSLPIAVFSLAVAASFLATAAGATEPPPPSKVARPVTAALETQPEVAVIVSLREPSALQAREIDVAALRSQVAATQSVVLAALPPAGFTITHRYRAVAAIAGRMSADGLEALARRPEVEEIELDGQGRAATGQSVPLIHADQAHNAGITGEGVVVAVLDSGVDSDHPDLAGDILYERCFLGPGLCPPGPHPAEDDHGHGTNVAGIITSDGSVAPLGVAPDAQIAAYKILDSSGLGFFSNWVAALDDIIADHPEVAIVNMSLQSSARCPTGALQTAVETLRAQGVATFIAAGNGGEKDSLRVPACIEESLSVGATYDAPLGTINGWKTDCSDVTTSVDQVACWSSSGDTLDLLAPGAAITSTGRGGGTSTFYGTSQATPTAAGVAALLLEAFPGLSVDQIETRMEATGRLVTDDLHDTDAGTNRTTPRVDARVALLAGADDTDGDGCLNEREYGADAALGGRRNPLNASDFYDVNGDLVINVFDDIARAANAFGPSSGGNYDPALDRSPAPPGADPWDTGPADGEITLDDVLAAIAQFGHACSGPP